MKVLSALTLLSVIAPGCTFTSGTLATGESPYVDVAAGAEVYFAGPPEGAAAALDLKLGYRWPDFSVDAALMWTHDMAWTAAHCEPSACRFTDRRDLAGIRGALQVYFLEPDYWLRTYLTFGLGLRSMHYHEVVWAGLILLGGGAEVSLFGGLTLNVAVLYSFTRFEHGIGSPQGRTNHAVQPMGGLRFYF
jgi:hypothetical protein